LFWRRESARRQGKSLREAYLGVPAARSAAGTLLISRAAFCAPLEEIELILYLFGNHRLLNDLKMENCGPASTILMRCLAAIPHLLQPSGGRSPGWYPNSPACGYPAVQWVFRQKIKIAFILTSSRFPILAK
jgi:hypothetical protein